MCVWVIFLMFEVKCPMVLDGEQCEGLGPQKTGGREHQVSSAMHNVHLACEDSWVGDQQGTLVAW